MIEYDINSLNERILKIRDCLDLDNKIKKLENIRNELSNPEIWQDVQKSSNLTQLADSLQKSIDEWNNLNSSFEDFLFWTEFQGEDVENEITESYKNLIKILEEMEIRALLSGKYDSYNAMLSISAGAGGVDAQDFAEMLLRMYIRWGEKNKYSVELVDQSPGDEAGIRSATIFFKGKYSYGFLKSEQGVHRLIRLSPFDFNNRRHTSFVLVEVTPLIENVKEVNVKNEDIKIETFRASGAGGQHVNKTDSAVRITHLPTGIVVTCRNERSQFQNKEAAMKILISRLNSLYEEKQKDKMNEFKGETDASWGKQIRTYVMHPYTMVKDHRTNVEFGDVYGVLDGNIDEFQKAFLLKESKEKNQGD
ncbi:peptide chain release factor 2 [Thermodesulfobium acidiphilum]|uniref:peptide chain release factor 2 n=1 Tax=Thermodesulfobium acidiphilum TaxID=1794699 RepID=UPI001F1A457E